MFFKIDFILVSFQQTKYDRPGNFMKCYLIQTINFSFRLPDIRTDT